LRRVLLVVAGVAVAAGALIGLVLILSARDESQLSGAPQGPGQVQPEGADPPASGPHSDALVTRDRRPLSDDQLVNALALGDVVVLYDGRLDPALVRLQKEVAGPFDAELAAAGQAVVLAPRDGAGPATALAWKRVLRANDPSDPALREFAEFWLGRGIP
jgi:Protein of unknown function (DUF3105)